MKIATFRASFGNVDAHLVADSSGLRLQGVARVESISINNPPEFRQHVVHGADFFDGDNHPEITVRSQDVQVHWGWTGSCRCPAAGMCGSLRRGSHNRRLLTAAAAELLPVTAWRCSNALPSSRRTTRKSRCPSR
ncbi:MAG: hypothetical protein DLM60_15405 [Pseudonocardiales bacterium]|nr:MAG: hypothetical protein DLM60_15405 [Pseudonocardiales bacterium]